MPSDGEKKAVISNVRYDRSTPHLRSQEGRRAETLKNHAYFAYIGNSLLEFMLRSSLSIIGTLIPIIRYLRATSNTPLLGRGAVRKVERNIYVLFTTGGAMFIHRLRPIDYTAINGARPAPTSSDGEEPVIRTITICSRVTTRTATHEVIGHPEWYNRSISTP